MLSRATEAVAARTDDTIGGLLNATLGNLTELLIALAALRAGQYVLVKASIAGAIVTNALFMLGASFLLGGLKHRVQEFNRASAHLHATLLFLATVALLVPSMLVDTENMAAAFTHTLSVGLAVLLIAFLSWPPLSVRNLSPLKAEDIVDEFVGIRFRDDQVRHALVIRPQEHLQGQRGG